jgi:hypothetical protein
MTDRNWLRFALLRIKCSQKASFPIVLGPVGTLAIIQFQKNNLEVV